MIDFDAVARLKADIAHFELLLTDGDLGAPVLGCPGWDLGALANHLAGIYRFASTAVEEGRESEVPAGPTDRAAISSWYAESAYELLHTFSQHHEEEPCWTMADPSIVGFWTRRMAHETALHLWDGESSQGTPTPIDPYVAADGIHEVVTMFFPRQVRLARTRPLSNTVRLETADVSSEHYLVLAGDGSSVHEGPVDATVWGCAEDILLMLWKRRTLAESPLRICGDKAAAERVLLAAVTP